MAAAASKVINLSEACRKRANRAFTKASELMNRANVMEADGLGQFADALVKRVDDESVTAERYDELADRYARGNP